jgi:hypothetical protein
MTPNEAIETTNPVEQENAAAEFATSVAETAPEVPEAVETEKKPDAEKTKPETPEAILAKAEQAKTEAEQARKDASTRLEKINSQHAALVRQRESFEKRQAALIEREKAIESLTTVSDITAHLAKARGVTADEIWQEWAEEIRNGGKPSEATQAKRDRDRIARENADLRKQAEEREANQSQVIVQQWGDEMDSALTADTFVTTYPKLAKVPQSILVDAIVAKTEEFRKANSGSLPRHADLLAWFESQIPEAAPPTVPVEAAKPKTKPTALTSKDTAAPPGIRELTDQEREEEAIRFASNLE